MRRRVFPKNDTVIQVCMPHGLVDELKLVACSRLIGSDVSSVVRRMLVEWMVDHKDMMDMARYKVSKRRVFALGSYDEREI